MNPTTPPANSTRRWPVRIIIAVVIIAVGMQFVRFVVPGFRLDNPPVTRTVAWDSSETEDLWRRACADCHSNETTYPFYAYLAPVGWLVADHVNHGRSHLNISESGAIDLEEVVEVIQEGEMPLPSYLPLHPEANLSDAEQQHLIVGLEMTFAQMGGGEGDESGATGDHHEADEEAHEHDDDD